jgi:hypothetical protein
MACVQQVKAAIGENEFFALLVQAVAEFAHLFWRHGAVSWFGHAFAIGQRTRGFKKWMVSALDIHFSPRPSDLDGRRLS